MKRALLFSVLGECGCRYPQLTFQYPFSPSSLLTELTVVIGGGMAVTNMPGQSASVPASLMLGVAGDKVLASNMQADPA